MQMWLVFSILCGSEKNCLSATLRWYDDWRGGDSIPSIHGRLIDKNHYINIYRMYVITTGERRSAKLVKILKYAGKTTWKS